jgi:hypothetical protein
VLVCLFGYNEIIKISGVYLRMCVSVSLSVRVNVCLFVRDRMRL